MSQTLPEGWATTTLGDLSTYVTSGSRDWSKYYADHGALFVRTQDINKNTLGSVDDIARVALPQRVEGKRTLITQGDLLITITGANVGKCALVDFPIPEAYVSQSVALVRLAKGFSGRFIQRQLTSPSSGDDRTLLQQSAYGVGRPVLNLDNVRELPIYFSPLNEQTRIIAAIEGLLSSVNLARDHLSRVPAILKRFRQAVLAAACSGRLTEDWREKNTSSQTGDQLFTDVVGHSPSTIPPESTPIDDLPDSWTWATLGEVSSLVTDGDHNPPKRTVAGIPHLTAKSIKKWRINFDACTFVTQRDFEKTRSRYEPREGDLIVTCVGTIGETAIVPKGCVFSADRNLAAIRVKPGALLPMVAQYILNAPPWVDTVREGSSSTAQPHLYLNTLRALIVPLIPLAEQRELVLRVRVLLELSDQIEQHVSIATSRADKLIQSILAKAFRGELVPTEAELARREGRECESASVLLERIKKERESQTSGKSERKRTRPRPTLQLPHEH